MVKKVIFPCSMPGGLAAPFSMYFGRSEAFTMVTLKNKDIVLVEVTQNFSGRTRGGTGVYAANAVNDMNPTDLVLGNIGPNAFKSLNSSEFRVFELGKHASFTVKEVLDEFLAGNVKILEKSNAIPHPE